MSERLDKSRILELLAEADTKWFSKANHEATTRYRYREHLEFTAEYIARNYHKESKSGEKEGAHG